MLALRSRLALAATVAALVALPGCGDEESVKRDAEDVRRSIDRGAGTVDERAKDAAEDAGRDAEEGLNDLEGK